MSTAGQPRRVDLRLGGNGEVVSRNGSVVVTTGGQERSVRTRVVAIGKRAPGQEAAEASTVADATVVAVVPRGVEGPEGQSDRHVLLDDECADLLHDLLELVALGSQVLGTGVGNAATDEARGHRHTTGEQCASLEREAANTERLDVAEDDSVPRRNGETVGGHGARQGGVATGVLQRGVVERVREPRGPRRDGGALNVARGGQVIEVRDRRHHGVATSNEVADVDGLLRHAVRTVVRERDVVAAVAEDRIDRVRGRHTVRNRADAADALDERDCVVRRAAEQEVLKTTPQVAVNIGLGNDA